MVLSCVFHLFQYFKKFTFDVLASIVASEYGQINFIEFFQAFWCEIIFFLLLHLLHVSSLNVGFVVFSPKKIGLFEYSSTVSERIGNSKQTSGIVPFKP